MARPEDRCFVRWRAAGDADALARVFDLAAPALLRIALHHVRHPALAEDLVQTTFLAAIERAAAYDPARPLLAWLVGILHNQAKWAARRDGRVVDAARLPERAAGDPLAAAQAAEFTAQVDEGIEQLPEIYRPVLRLHLAHELSAVEIAHALGRPSGTVRSQIVRGLELLRAALPAGAALAAFAVLTPARGVAAMREAVLAAGRVRTATVAAAAAGATVLATTMGIKKVLLGAACALACGAGAWVAGSAVMGADAGAVPAASPRAVTAAVGDTAVEAQRSVATPAARQAVTAAAP
ncbi:MAG TPA: sigma-70 family RNA polymerase sigma factor, partial [Planctomycetota bacterium]|nr:sigma-70 family RNA polymerase sigma factor [Planctomycetota bacterium]